MTSLQVFEKFVPDEAVAYCNNLYETMGFEFKITKSRRTKLGDFRFKPDNKKSIITINNDLNSYAFLVTFLHEVAHLITFQKFTNRVAPHGSEWKREFTNISVPLLTKDVFPPSILISLTKYFQNPKASSCSDPNLYRALRHFDSPTNKLPLNDIQNQQSFIFNKRRFIRMEKKRTRWVCEEINSKRKYLINGIADVEVLEVNS
ncbi:MAG: SprT family zinc-dependent metalloprotease [Cytophagales bacterium]|nr:SprT family zinc-dependent metalloprotease [Cytophagales bacterium]